MSKSNDHLPFFGVGPLYACVIIALTVAAFFCRNAPLFAGGNLAAIRIPLTVVGVIVIILGIIIWVSAVVFAKVDANIAKNKLVTTGIYAWVRNPVYTGITFACIGVLLIAGNAWFFILPFIFWLFLTVLMIKTEEVWLRKQFGQPYEEYCKHVNRCWPWFPKKG